MKLTYYSRILFFILLLLAFVISCKHKEKQVNGVVKHKPAKPGKTARAPAPGTNDNHATAGTSDDWRQKLGVTSKQMKESKLYVFINEWYGVPYKYGGCQKSGIDCSCFTNLLCEKVYDRKIGRSASDMYKDCDKISIEDAKEGDLFFFKINGNTISHVGVYVKNRSFVHSSTSKGVIINSLDEAYYKKYFFCAGRIRKI